MNATGPPPAASTPDLFSHAEGRSRELFYTSALLPVFIIPIVILRLWTSIKIVRKWHTDDTLIIIATVLALLFSVCLCFAARLGTGAQMGDVTRDGLMLITSLIKYCALPLYNGTLVFVKVSVFAFYLRFTIDVYFKACAYTFMGIVVSSTVANIVISTAAVCAADLTGRCQLITISQTVYSVFNVATDVAILLLPFWLLHPMKVPLGRKVGIAIVLMAGGFVLVVSIVRLISTVEVTETGGNDVSYVLAYSLQWCIIECWTGTLCACLPCLKAFLSYLFPIIRQWGLLDRNSSGSRRRLATVTS